MNLNLFRKKIEEIVALKSLTDNIKLDRTKEYALNILVEEKFEKLGYSEKQRQLIFAVKLQDFENALKTSLGKKGYYVEIDTDRYFPAEMNVCLTITNLKPNGSEKMVCQYDISYNGELFEEIFSKFDFVLPLDSLTNQEYPDWVRLISDFPQVKKIMWSLIESKIKQSKQNRISLIEKRIKENESKKLMLSDSNYINAEISHLSKENKILEEQKSKLDSKIKNCDIDEIVNI